MKTLKPNFDFSQPCHKKNLKKMRDVFDAKERESTAELATKDSSDSKIQKEVITKDQALSSKYLYKDLSPNGKRVYKELSKVKTPLNNEVDY